LSGKPVPLVVANSGDVGDAPVGAMPIGLYGAGSGGGESGVSSVNGKTGDVVLDAESVNAVPNSIPGATIFYKDLAGEIVGISPYGFLNNYAGQVRVNYANLSLTIPTANTLTEFDIGAATPTIAGYPTTIFPFQSVESYDPGFYDSQSGRLRENLISGQVHTWRIVGTFANKNFTNTGALYFKLFNPNSSFQLISAVDMPQGVTGGTFTSVFQTISDTNSLGSGMGYKLGAEVTFIDDNFTVSISSILRISSSIENFPNL
jgi:hypothetical protein